MTQKKWLRNDKKACACIFFFKVNGSDHRNIIAVLFSARLYFLSVCILYLCVLVSVTIIWRECCCCFKCSLLILFGLASCETFLFRWWHVSCVWAQGMFVACPMCTDPFNVMVRSCILWDFFLFKWWQVSCVWVQVVFIACPRWKYWSL
jgi:hypothetical protein